jgi:hypothetical protein
MLLRLMNHFWSTAPYRTSLYLFIYHTVKKKNISAVDPSQSTRLLLFILLRNRELYSFFSFLLFYYSFIIIFQFFFFFVCVS